MHLYVEILGFACHRGILRLIGCGMTINLLKVFICGLQLSLFLEQLCEIGTKVIIPFKSYMGSFGN